MSLTGEQQIAIDRMVKYINTPTVKYVSLVGQAGTGKTYTIQRLLSKLPSHLRVCFTSTTNKATRVLESMSSKCGLSVRCMTIHSLLGLTVSTNKTGEVVLKYSKKLSQIKGYNVVIVDECSMVNLELFEYIKKAVTGHSDITIIFMGDENQLNPVGETQSKVFNLAPKIKLNQVMRQSADNPILDICSDIRQALDTKSFTINKLQPKTSESGLKGIHYLGGAEFRTYMLDAFISDEFETDPDYFRVVAWRNKTVDLYNSIIQRYRYPDLTQPFAIGERVVFNTPMFKISSLIDYNPFSKIEEIHDGIKCSTETDGIVRKIESISPFEMNVGVVTHTIPRYKLHVELYDTRVVECVISGDNDLLSQLVSDIADSANARSKVYTWTIYRNVLNYFSQLRPIYACTVHKSQGSTYENLFVDTGDILTNGNVEERLRCLYVAVSRASHNIVINRK